MRVCPDTNVLVRAFVRPANEQDAHQGRIAQRLLREASQIVVTLPVLCEMAWVLRSGYRISAAEVVATIRRLVEAQSVVCDRHAVEFGLQFAAAGGDFSDGVIAQAGYLSGAEMFASFDKRAVRLLNELGHSASEPA